MLTGWRDGGDREQREPSLGQHGKLSGDVDRTPVDRRPVDGADDDARLTLNLGSHRSGRPS